MRFTEAFEREEGFLFRAPRHIACGSHGYVMALRGKRRRVRVLGSTGHGRGVIFVHGKNVLFMFAAK